MPRAFCHFPLPSKCTLSLRGSVLLMSMSSFRIPLVSLPRARYRLASIGRYVNPVVLSGEAALPTPSNSVSLGLFNRFRFLERTSANAFSSGILSCHFIKDQLTSVVPPRFSLGNNSRSNSIASKISFLP